MKFLIDTSRIIPALVPQGMSSSTSSSSSPLRLAALACTTGCSFLLPTILLGTVVNWVLLDRIENL